MLTTKKRAQNIKTNRKKHKLHIFIPWGMTITPSKESERDDEGEARARKDKNPKQENKQKLHTLTSRSHIPLS
jgi:hypothetical protein